MRINPEAARGWVFQPFRGGALGGVTLRNASSHTCMLRGRPEITFYRHGKPLPAIVEIAGSFLPPAPRVRTVTVRPGQVVVAKMLWMNWCHPYRAPDRLDIALAPRDAVHVRFNAFPQCIDPSTKSTVAVEPFILVT